MSVYLSVCVCVFVCECVYVSMCVCLCVYVCMYMCMCMCMYMFYFIVYSDYVYVVYGTDIVCLLVLIPVSWEGLRTRSESYSGDFL